MPLPIFAPKMQPRADWDAGREELFAVEAGKVPFTARFADWMAAINVAEVEASGERDLNQSRCSNF